LALAVCSLACCGGGRKGATAATATDAVGVLAPVDKNGLVTIDLTADYPEQEIRLQDVAEVEYVPLAMSDKVLLSPSDRLFYLSDRYIMVSSSKTGEICVFDRMGKIVSHFNRQGRGPGEYIALGAVLFDDKAEEFFVFDLWGLAPKIIVYTLDGKHQRTLPLPKWWMGSMYNFDERALLVYDTSGLLSSGEEYSTTPYRLISKADGSVIETLPIKLPERYSSRISKAIPIRPDYTEIQWTELYVPNNRLGGKDFTLVDMSSDTIYRYSRERVLTPVLVRTPSVHAFEPRMVWSAEFVTEDFIHFLVTTLDFGGNADTRSLMYDFKTGHVSDAVFINDDNSKRGTESDYDQDTEAPVGTTVKTLNPLRLVEAREKGELNGPLAEIASNLKEDDNPVVMIVKFK
jgi:hypothetical protein